ncbi:MAG: sugar phosphate isomerase/epimerase, partial [Planctomycetia bacterium]|nr:sugar phosphate isomerase/epimerase [Planctomycetia bacterium]
AYPEALAEDLAGLLALAKKGRPIEPFAPPDGVDRKQAERDYQLAELARSIAHCRDVLGLGVRP